MSVNFQHPNSIFSALAEDKRVNSKNDSLCFLFKQVRPGKPLLLCGERILHPEGHLDSSHGRLLPFLTITFLRRAFARTTRFQCERNTECY